MKNVILMTALMMGLATVAHAQVNFDTNNAFEVTGAAICDTDCSAAAKSAEDDATEAAIKACAPQSAHQISQWLVNVQGFGRLTASATFDCQ